MKTLRYYLRTTALLSSLLFAPAAFAATTNTSTHKASDFDSGNLSPFYVCTTQSPNYVQANTFSGETVAKFHWMESAFNGTRMTKGAELCSEMNTYKEGWYAFNIYVPSSGFPNNKKTIIGQIFSEGGCSSWAGTFSIENNELWIEHRHACVNPTRTRIASSIPRDRWVRLVSHFRVSHENAGLLNVWWDGAPQSSPSYSSTNINFGFGDWEDDTLKSSGDSGIFGSGTDNMIRLKVGMYCFDDANYTIGETRTLYYDDVVHINGNPSNAWAACNPNSGSATYDRLRNRATALYVDGMGQTSNGSNLGQYANTNHINSHWETVFVGDARKFKNRGTGLYIDGMGRTSNGSDVGQWSDSSSYNQQWWRSNPASGYFKFQNRATGLYLDGMGRTANGSNMGQWSSSSSYNQQFQYVAP